ncbi:MAG: hypothetical protein HYV01_06270 [Deltaproteobacteria bacterium]|nr:hypothetical protein [Deltaproteobacteria bacterium]
MRYRVYGLTLSSDVPVHELVPLAGAESEAESDVRVCFWSGRKKSFTPSRWFMSWTLPTGELWLQCAKDGCGYLLRFPEIADFFVDAEGREIICAPEPETPMETIRHLLLDQVLPLVLNLKGREALHATAILTPLGVCAFVGPTGAGKSTLAASFLRAGYAVLSDDCLVVESIDGRIFATPAYPGLRLWPDSVEALRDVAGGSQPVAHYTSKQRLIAERYHGDFPSDPRPLARIYSLSRPPDAEAGAGLANPRIERLSHRDSFMELIQFTFRFDITNREMLLRQFGVLERLVSNVPVRRLQVPDALSSLPAVCEAVLADLNNRGDSVVDNNYTVPPSI